MFVCVRSLPLPPACDCVCQRLDAAGLAYGASCVRARGWFWCIVASARTCRVLCLRALRAPECQTINQKLAIGHLSLFLSLFDGSTNVYTHIQYTYTNACSMCDACASLACHPSGYECKRNICRHATHTAPAQPVSQIRTFRR